MSATSNPASSSPPKPSSPPTPGSDPRSLPSLITSTASPPSARPRPMSFASKQRLSQYSTGSFPSRSRPQSHIFPVFPSSLPYTLVRDFAYPTLHPLHYGPPAEPSGPPSGYTTPSSEQRRLSDPPASWEQKMPWDSWTADGFNRGHEIPPIQFGEGPPYSEDDDLQSPVVSSRHKKHKSTSAATLMKSGQGSNLINAQAYVNERGFFVGTGGDGSERYYVSHEGEANGPGGEVVTYPPGDPRHSSMYHAAHRSLPADGSGGYAVSEDSSPPSSPGYHEEDQSRYSRDYQFTITSPDEEFHGKAVALFDFERDNENELPLIEGQIIWVSYRYGQGWLVAEDPKTQESGLVPEEYVRLLRDIEGGMNSLTGAVGNDGSGSPNEAGTPTQAEHSVRNQPPAAGNGTNGYNQPVVSMFSTSSKDLNPYPTDQLGLQAGQAPPQVVHYQGQRGGSQVNTPTLTQHQEGDFERRGSQDTHAKTEKESAPSHKPSSGKFTSQHHGG